MATAPWDGPRPRPFDAIIVTAGGPEIPETLRNQLKIGGRLIMPIGVLANEQRLVKVVRDGEHAFHEEDLGAVRFVPLVGEHGWPDEAVPVRAEFKAPGVQPGAPAELLRTAAEPLPEFDDPAFGPLFDRFADARVVLLGEATHGTSEFYRARAAITRRLIEQHGFTIVAVEADWPDAAAIDRYVRHEAPSADGRARRSSAFRPGCGATTRCTTSSTGCARTTTARPGAPRRASAGSTSTACAARSRAVLDYLDESIPKPPPRRARSAMAA